MKDLYKHAIVLTGGIATGKSTVSKLLQKKGFVIIDADKVAHEMLDAQADAIAEMFGDAYVKEGRVDRKALGGIIFSKPDNRAKLEALLHPLIQAEIAQQATLLEEKKMPYIIDIPLFFESQNYEIEKVALVYAPLKIQRERLMKRDGLSEEEANHRINAQLSIEKKKAMSAFVVDNSHDLAYLDAEVDALIAYINED